MTTLTSNEFDVTVVGDAPTQAWSYIGVPYVTDMVPSAIMPTLPTGPDTVVWPWDPCLVERPTWTDASNQYYIDPSAGNASDSNNGGRGSPSAPRSTLPGWTGGNGGSWTLSAGDQLFIAGGNSFGSNFDLQSFTFPGTADDPIWIMGVGDKPVFNFDKFFITGASYVMWDNLYFGSTNGWRNQTTGCNNICWRNNLFTGNPAQVISGSSRRLLSITGANGAENHGIVIYNNVFHSLGKWNPGVEAIDCLGVHVQAWNRHTWVIDNEIYHMQGDSVMTGNSNYWTFTYEQRSHYTYIAGNLMYENYENMFDAKNSFHTVVSENTGHTFYTSGSEPSANSTALIMCQDGEGYLDGYVWILNNYIYDCGVGIRSTPTADECRTWAIGNLIVNAGTGFNSEARSSVGNTGIRTTFVEVGCINNTFVNCGEGLKNTRGVSSTETILDYSGNIVYNCDGEYDVWMEGFTTQQYFRDNVIYRPGGGENVRLDGSYVENTNNSVGTDPLLDANYVPDVTSVAVDLAEEHYTFQLFEDLYGLDIRVDRRGATRPQGAGFDSGAHEAG